MSFLIQPCKNTCVQNGEHRYKGWIHRNSRHKLHFRMYKNRLSFLHPYYLHHYLFGCQFVDYLREIPDFMLCFQNYSADLHVSWAFPAFGPPKLCNFVRKFILSIVNLVLTTEGLCQSLDIILCDIGRFSILFEKNLMSKFKIFTTGYSRVRAARPHCTLVRAGAAAVAWDGGPDRQRPDGRCHRDGQCCVTTGTARPGAATEHNDDNIC